jgi:hypothetical protein
MSNENIIYDGIVINASKELVPTIRIAPLDLSTITQSDEQYDGQKLLHTDKCVSIHKKARYAITAALEDLQLRKEDVVTILTTSGNYYVSGCVTRAIEMVCKWNREVTKDTKAILVIHEFGYPYKGLSELKKYGLPIIEDCAYAYFTKDEEMGHVGDYVIFSLTKAFNMPVGGVMVSKNKVEDKVSGEERDCILSSWVTEYKKDSEIIKKRLDNYAYLAEELASLGITPFFDLSEGGVPGAFLFRWRDDINYPELKEYMQRNGVESSVFYTELAFYIPVHQNLSKNESDYMIKLLKYFYETRERK